jgi:hypothetical protein
MPDYANLISCQVEWAGGSRTVVATLFPTTSRAWFKLMAIASTCARRTHLGHPELRPPRFHWPDWDLLGEHGINIATWRTGRDKAGGLAISFIGIDSDIPESVIKIVQDFELVMSVKKVKL